MIIKSKQRGISAIEYVILAVVIVGAVAAAAALFGDDLKTAFGLVGDEVVEKATPPAEEG